MKVSNKLKKGFTIVELVIVIAIIAILAAVLVPTFANLIDKANVSADTQLVRNLNVALKADSLEKHENMTEALRATEESGFDVAKISAKAVKGDILWDSKNDVFCYLNDTTLEYIPDSVAANERIELNSPEVYKLWKIYSDANNDLSKVQSGESSEKYSAYLGGEDWTGALTVTAKGVDVGANAGISITYSNTSAQKVVIRTNRGTLTITTASGGTVVTHYGVVDTKSITGEVEYIERGSVIAVAAEESEIDANVLKNAFGEDESGNITIADNAFNNATGKNLTSINIPEGVTSIGNNAFKSCTNLTSVTIPSTVTTIGQYAFKGCSSLTSVTIPASVTTINKQAFRDCTSLTSVTLENGLTTIGEQMFYGCTSLESVTIPSTVETIGNYAFAAASASDSNKIQSIIIPEGVTSIGSSAFKNCTALESVTIPNSVTSIKSSAFSGCTSLTSVTIPNGVTSIGEYTFQGCSALTGVTIPNGVTSIGNSAFQGCSALTGVTIPERVTSIGNSAFQGCSALTGVTIPERVTSIGSGAFQNCSKLQRIDIPSGVSTIDQQTFSGCTKLENVTIPTSVTLILASAFTDCKSLGKIAIPSTVTNIGSSAFSGCTALKSIDGSDNPISMTIPSTIASIGKSAFANCTSLPSDITISGNSSLGDLLFQNCTQLTSVKFGANINSINAKAFGYTNISTVEVDGNNGSYKHGDSKDCVLSADGTRLVLGCKKVSSIPDTVTTIAQYAFYYRTGITEISISAKVKTIGKSAFEGSGLTSATIAGTTSWSANRIGLSQYLIVSGKFNAEKAANYLKGPVVDSLGNRQNFSIYEWTRT